MTFKNIPVKLTVSAGLELFKKLGIEVTTQDMIDWEPCYHNSVKEVLNKRLVAICPETGKVVDFMQLYEDLINERVNEVILAGTTPRQIINLIQTIN